MVVLEVEKSGINITPLSSDSQWPELDKMKKMKQGGKETSINSSVQYLAYTYIAFQNISTLLLSWQSQYQEEGVPVTVQKHTHTNHSVFLFGL